MSIGLAIAIAAITAIFAIAPRASAAERFEDNVWWKRRVLLIAHSGGECEAPTNTLYAWKTALASGADMLELDVQLSADGELVVIHDDTVDRTTNGSGRVDQMSVAELKALDNAYEFQLQPGDGCTGATPGVYPFRGVATGAVAPPAGFDANDFRIPTLREVLESFPESLMSIEIKGSAPEAFAAAESLASMLRSFGRDDDVLIASFDDAVIAHFKQLAPEIHTTPGTRQTAAFLFGGLPIDEHHALQLPPTYSGVDITSAENVAFIHSQGLPVYVFLQESIELDSLYQQLIDAGVDGVITGRPAGFEAVLARNQARFAAGLALGSSELSVEGRTVQAELACPAWAGAPWCRGAARFVFEYRTASGVLRRAELGRPAPIAVARGEAGVANLRLSLFAAIALALAGPFDAQLEVTPLGALDAPMHAPVRLELQP
jgi:glycerophosphoryl diester phosphodiesterase